MDPIDESMMEGREAICSEDITELLTMDNEPLTMQYTCSEIATLTTEQYRPSKTPFHLRHALHLGEVGRNKQTHTLLQLERVSCFQAFGVFNRENASNKDQAIESRVMRIGKRIFEYDGREDSLPELGESSCAHPSGSFHPGWQQSARSFDTSRGLLVDCSRRRGKASLLLWTVIGIEKKAMAFAAWRESYTAPT